MKHLFHACSSPNIAAPSYAQCRGPRDVDFDRTFGWGVGSPERTDVKNSECLVLIGSHLGENMHNTQVQEFAEGIRNGATIITMEYAKTRVEAAGPDCDVLQRDGVIVGEARPLYFEEGAPPVFYTASGKIELNSQRLAENGFDPMPTWHDNEVEDPPQGYYRLLFGRFPVHNFGRTTNNRLLSEVMDENGVRVNRKVAERWGLTTGDRVYLQKQDGVRSTFSAPVKVTDRIHPDAVYMVHGYGRKAKKLKQVCGKGIDEAELITRYRTHPIMGGTGMNVNFVNLPSGGGCRGPGSVRSCLMWHRRRGGRPSRDGH